MKPLRTKLSKWERLSSCFFSYVWCASLSRDLVRNSFDLILFDNTFHLQNLTWGPCSPIHLEQLLTQLSEEIAEEGHKETIFTAVRYDLIIVIFNSVKISFFSVLDHSTLDVVRGLPRTNCSSTATKGWVVTLQDAHLAQSSTGMAND